MGELVLEFPAPTRPLSENEKRKMSHWGQWRRRLDPWHTATRAAWSAIPLREREPFIDTALNVLVELPFKKNARRDPHNYVGTNVKSVVDALTIKPDWDGCWPDDTPEWVTVLEPKIVVKSDDIARVILTHREA